MNETIIGIFMGIGFVCVCSLFWCVICLSDIHDELRKMNERSK